MRKTIVCFFLFFSLVCISQSTTNRGVHSSTLPFRPNILWLVTEDLSPLIPPFGDSTITTPVLSRLAKEGVRYTHVFSPSGVCAPSRAALALGMYPSHVGAMHMRNGFWAAGRPSAAVAEAQRKSFPPNIPYYEAVPAAGARMHSEYLRMQGYYCSNRYKQDYQFVAPVTAWDDCSPSAHWHGRQGGQPFFSIFNFEVTHESQIWGKAKDSMWIGANTPVKVPPYLPSTPIALNDIRRMYSNIKEMDFQVGKMIDQLEKEGLLDSTIIFWYADHGGPLPRQKRLCYDSGLRAPLIIRYPNKWRAGQIDSQLISFVDFLPTLMSMTNTRPTALTDGRSFAGAYESKTKRKYIHGGGDRFDEQYDMIRAVRDQRYKYLRNFDTSKAYYLPVAYREQMPIMQELLRLHKLHQLNEYQEQWFRASKPKEELFDTYTDPFELHNIAADAKYKTKLGELRKECDRWMKEIDDKGKMKEIDYLHSIWHGDNKPVTADPVIKRHSNLASISCVTPGASIGYKIIHDNTEKNGWSIYQKPVPLLPGDKLKVIAHRIGYEPSRILEF